MGVQHRQTTIGMLVGCILASDVNYWHNGRSRVCVCARVCSNRCVLYEMATLDHPFDANSLQALSLKVGALTSNHFSLLPPTKMTISMTHQQPHLASPTTTDVYMRCLATFYANTNATGLMPIHSFR